MNTQHGLYKLGQVVVHTRYGYRGVIVAIDPECRAPEEWYQANVTQPKRSQPWYHVLVDGGHETYVAQSNLELDTEGGPINHPAISRFFQSFFEGKYYQQNLN